jgi:hypothetical protein
VDPPVDGVRQDPIELGVDFEEQVRPLLTEAYELAVRKHARQQARGGSG